MDFTPAVILKFKIYDVIDLDAIVFLTKGVLHLSTLAWKDSIRVLQLKGIRSMSTFTRRQRCIDPDSLIKGRALFGVLMCVLMSVASAFVESSSTGNAAIPFLRSPIDWSQTRRSVSRSVEAPRVTGPAKGLSMVAKSGADEIESAESFEEIVLSPDIPRPCLVFFSAPWCGPCRLSNPVVRDVMKQFAGRIDVVEACTDDLPEVASDAGVVSIPTIQIYFRGELLDSIIGCVAKNVLASAVTKILEDLGEEGPGSGE